MPITTMTSKGQITLPAEVRARLRLVAGSKFSVRETPEGEIVLKPKTGDIRALKGIANYGGPPVSVEEMNEAILKAASKRFHDSVK